MENPYGNKGSNGLESALRQERIHKSASPGIFPKNSMFKCLSEMSHRTVVNSPMYVENALNCPSDMIFGHFLPQAVLNFDGTCLQPLTGTRRSRLNLFEQSTTSR